MYRETPAAWHRDVKWLAGLALVPLLAAGIWFFSLAQLTGAQRARPLLERVLQLTLLPEGGDGEAVAVRRGVEHTPGEPLALLPGVDVHAAPDEIADLGPDTALERVADALTERTLAEGAAGTTALVEDPLLARQLQLAFQGPLRELLEAQLGGALLPAGLDDGSRLADWPTQAVQNPGEPVQPVVGVFVYADPETLALASEREIGELVVARLATLVLEQGLDAAQAVVTNETLLAALGDTVRGPVRSALHDTFVTLLVSRRPLLEERLTQVQALLADEPEARVGLLGVLSAEQLDGASPEEANARLLTALAERAYAGGGAALLPLLPEAQQSERLASALPLLDALSREAHGRYLRWSWLTGLGVLVLTALLASFSSGWGRLLNPGLAWALAAAGGALLFQRLGVALDGAADASPPLSLRAEGLFAHLAGILAYLGANLPSAALELLLRNHLVVLALGGALVALTLLARLLRLLRPRRRAYL